MGWGEFPIATEKRKVILVLSNTDIEMCQYQPNDVDILLDEEAYVLNFPLDLTRELPLALHNIIDSRLVTPGSMLIQNPYDSNLYEEASIASENFALAKHMYFSTFCMYLGAKKVCVEQCEIETKNGKMTFDANGNIMKASMQVEIDQGRFSKFCKKMCLIDEFKGGPPDISSAESFLRVKGLLNDANMKSLLDIRYGSNPLQTRTLMLDVSREAKANLNIASQIKVPAFVKLAADYSTILREQYSISLKINVSF